MLPASSIVGALYHKL